MLLNIGKVGYEAWLVYAGASVDGGHYEFLKRGGR